MTTLLIIGGTGFFGKSFLDSFRRGVLNKWGVDKIIAMARSADQLKITAPQLLSKNVELVNADVGLTDYLPSADYVIHAAASTDERNYVSRPETERTNIEVGVYNYCRLAPKFHANSKIVYVSSGAVYGVQSPNIPFLKEDSLSLNLEDMSIHKRSYAKAKRNSEMAIKLLSEEHGLSTSIARCFSFVGPWLPRDQHFAIGNFLKNGIEGKTIHVKATSPVYRSYMYSDDLVNWLMSIAQNASSSCDVYNVGSDYEISIIDLAKLISRICSVSVSSEAVCSDVVDRYIPSIEKAKTSLGLELNTDLVECISYTINEVINNR